MSDAIPIPICRQGGLPSGGMSYLDHIQASRSVTTANATLPSSGANQVPSQLLEGIRAALRGPGVEEHENMTAQKVIQCAFRSDIHGEEELAWDTNTVCLSIGGTLRKRWDFSLDGETVRYACLGWIEQKDSSYSTSSTSFQNSKGGPTDLMEEKLRHPAFGPFSWSSRHKFREAKRHSQVNRACFIFLRTAARIFVLNGNSYTVALPFLVRRAWAAYPHGVIMQRCIDSRELEEAATSDDPPLPSLFSLTSPFTEISAIGLSKDLPIHTGVEPGNAEYDEEQSRHTLVTVPATETVVWVSPFSRYGSSENLAASVDVEARKLSIWRYAYIPPQDLPVSLTRPRTTTRHAKSASAVSSTTPTTPVSPTPDHASFPLHSNIPNLSTVTKSTTLLSNDINRTDTKGKVQSVPASEPNTPARERKEAAARHDLSTNMNRMTLDGRTEHILPPSDHGQMKASYWMRRLYSRDIDAIDAEKWKSIQVEAFDGRFDGRHERSLLAILFPSFRWFILSVIKESDGTLRVFPRSENKGVRAIAALYATRANCTDLLAVGVDGGLGLHNGYHTGFTVTTLTLEELTSGRIRDTSPIIGLEAAVGSCVTLVHADGVRSRVSLSRMPVCPLTQRCFEILSLTLPKEDYSSLVRRHLNIWYDWTVGDNRYTEFDAFCKAFEEQFNLPSASGTISQPSQKSWAKITSSRSHLNLGDDPTLRKLNRRPMISCEASNPPAQTPNGRAPHSLLAPVLNALHLLGEDLRLQLTGHQSLLRLAPLICRIALLIRPEWADYWKRLCPNALVTWPAPSAANIQYLDDRLPAWPIDMTAVLFGRINTPDWSLTPHPRNLGQHFNLTPSFALGRIEPLPSLAQLTMLYMCLADNTVKDSRKRAENALTALVTKLNTSTDILGLFPLGLASPIREAARTCQLAPAGNWTSAAYRLIDRNDLAEAVSNRSDRLVNDGYLSVRDTIKAQHNRESILEVTKKAHSAGSGEMSLVTGVELDLEGFTEIRFGQDRRLEEVARMLCSSAIPSVKMPERPDASEHDLARDYQHQIARIAERTLALPYGRAMFTFGSVPTLTREAYSIPKLEFTIRIQPQNTTIGPDQHKIPKECTDWGEFHNGVAAGLRIAPNAKPVESSWIAFNKPSELTPEHAGFLYALGLTGHLKEMLTWQTFGYLTPKHDLTSIGVLLGLSAANVGTGNEHVTKLLAVHAPAMLPNPDVDLNIPLMTQSAALSGIGLLYMGSRKRHIAEVLLNEIRRKDLVQPDLTNEHREAYTLSSAFAFGMIMLGKGSSIPADASLVERLRVLIHGEPITTYGIHRPSFDINLTSPAASIALGLMYLRTERRDIAEVLTIPDAIVELHRIQPSFLLMRTIARALIMWNDVQPKNEWVMAQIPILLARAMEGRFKGEAVDDALELAYFNILAGSCFAIALKYAGTAREEAYLLIISYYDLFSRVAYTNAAAFDARIKRSAIREGLNLLSIALNMVMAGTGEINCLRRLRYAYGMYTHLIRYGTHTATHMSLGLLFLGGGRYTLGNSDAAIACMVIAFYPRFPHVSSDNKCYLQALRHLWVLAIEPRCLVARDVDTKEVVYLPVKIKVDDGTETAATQLIAPTLIPDLDKLRSIRVDTPRYWPFFLDVANFPRHKESLLRNQTLYVKRRSAFLSYTEDPKGSRSLFVRSGSSTADAATLDFPQLTDIKTHPAGDLDNFISSFSNDVFFLAFADYMCRGDGVTTEEKVLGAYCHAALLDALLQDKPRTLQSHLSLYQYRMMSPRSPYFNIRLHDLRFTADFYNKTFERRFSGRYENNPRNSLIREATVVGTLHALDEQLDKVRVDPSFISALGHYARGEQVPSGPSATTAENESALALGWYLSRNSVPVSSLLSVLRELAEQAHKQCIGLQPPEGTGDAITLDRGIKQVLHSTGTQMTTTMGTGWSVRSLDEVIAVWAQTSDHT